MTSSSQRWEQKCVHFRDYKNSVAGVVIAAVDSPSVYVSVLFRKDY